MPMIAHFIFVNFLSSVSMGVFLITLPWLIVKMQGANSLIAVSALAMIVLYVLRKKSGALVDSYPRGILFASSMFLMSLCLAFLAFRPDNVALMLGVFFFGQIYLFFYYVLRSAITREIVPTGQFGRYNGILEIEGQVSTFVAGGLTAYLFEQNLASLPLIIGCAAMGMLVSGLLVLVKLNTNKPNEKRGDNSNETASGNYSSTLLILSYCGSIPFICVMLLNVIKPIVVVDVLQYPIEVLALTSVFYTVGAIAAGLLGSQSWIETASERVIFLMLVAFLASCLLPAFVPSATVLYLSSVIWGVSNGLSRITWQTSAMNEIGNEQIGSFFASISAGVGVLRIGLLFGYWAATAFWGYQVSFIYLVVVCSVGLLAFSAKRQPKRKFE
ncbi:MAG: MFS transporter [Alphaproteobacteria bacterium]